ASGEAADATPQKKERSAAETMERGVRICMRGMLWRPSPPSRRTKANSETETCGKPGRSPAAKQRPLCSRAVAFGRGVAERLGGQGKSQGHRVLPRAGLSQHFCVQAGQCARGQWGKVCAPIKGSRTCPIPLRKD